MNLTEIKAKIEGFAWVHSILKDETVLKAEDNLGVAVHHVHVLDVSGEMSVITKICANVVDEGKETEEAFFDSEFHNGYPTSRIKNKTVSEVGSNDDGTVYAVTKLVDTSGEVKEISEKQAVVSEVVDEVTTK